MSLRVYIMLCIFIAIGAFTEANAARLGEVVEKYEGINDPCYVSIVRDDKGGASYGLYQFNTTSNIIHQFILKYGYGLGLYKSASSRGFPLHYIKQCKKNPKLFAKFQRKFAQEVYFEPIRKYATLIGVPCTNYLNEALFSIAIQHGGAKKIISKAKEAVELVDSMQDPFIWLNALYQSRSHYVANLNLSDRIKKAILNRYIREIQDVANIARGDRVSQITVGGCFL